MPTRTVGCANCGAEVQVEEGYCPSCGTALGTRLCVNGHVMDAQWSECRYCSAKPAAQVAGSDLEKGAIATTVPPADTGDFGSRAGLLEGPIVAPRVSGRGEELPPEPRARASREPAPRHRSVAPKHRTVYDPGLVPEVRAPAAGSPPAAGGARLVGWLVSFTLDPFGVGFPLREGRNVLGADPDCDVVIEGDPGISGKHAVLMCRQDQIQVRDNDSTNGTYINGRDIFGQGAVKIERGDRIRLGQAELTVHLL